NRLTHTVTHTGKRADGNSGDKSAKDLILLSENVLKLPESSRLKALNRLVRMRSPVRIWIAAPKNPQNHMILGIFVAVLRYLMWVTVWVNCLTHTVTHMPKGPERTQDHRI
ncbi:MAG: hypothetical protein RR450_08165, partial [Oscillospiraceae bacterium]